MERARILNSMLFPELTSPFPFKILWLKTGNPHLKNEDSGRIPHHHRFYEIHFYLEGEAEYLSDRHDVMPIERNQFIIFPPGVIHEKLQSDRGAIRFSLAYELGVGSQSGDGELCEYLICHRPFVGFIAPDMRDILTNIISELDFYSELTPVILSNYLFNIIYRVCRQANPRSTERKKRPEIKSIDARVRSAMSFINDNLDMPMTAMTVAEYSHISYKQLNRLFLGELKTTVLRYIHEQKNERAKKLLAANELSLAQISLAVGFENEYYFNSFFKKMNGISPGAYRKEKRTYSKNLE